MKYFRYNVMQAQIQLAFIIVVNAQDSMTGSAVTGDQKNYNMGAEHVHITVFSTFFMKMVNFL